MTTDWQTGRLRDERPVLAGRDRERARLDELLSSTLSGVGTLALVSGEAGIGKTALVRDLAQQAGERGALVLSGGCYDLATTPPYGPWSEALQTYRPAGDQPLLPTWVGSHEALPEAGSQSALFEHAQRIFAVLADVQSLVIILEDLHWSDQASLDLLRFLAHRNRMLGMLIVITYRDDELTRRHPFIQHLSVIARETNAARIELKRLDTSAVRELVARYGLGTGEAERLVAYLEQRAIGNPFFTTELLRALESEGILRVDGADTRLGELDQDLLPSFVQPVIEHRLDRLDSESRRALELAAVIGQETPLELWEAVSGLPPANLDRAIEQALDLYVMEETADRQGLAFTHALVRDVLYQGIIPTRRRVWHRQVGEALAATTAPDPGAVAHHLQQAGDERAIEWHIRAGFRARRSASFSAAQHFELAVEMLEGNARRVRELGWLRYEAGRLLYHSGEPRSIEHLNAAERLGWLTNDPILAAAACAIRGMQRCARGDVRLGLRELRNGAAAIESLLEARFVREPGCIDLPHGPVGLDEGWADHVTSQLDGNAGGLKANRWRQNLVNWLGHLGYYREAATTGEALLADEPLTFEAGRFRPTRLESTQLGLGFTYAALGRPADARRAFTLAREGFRTDGSLELFELAIWADLLLVVIPYETDQLAERARLVAEAKWAWERCRGLTIAIAGDGAPSELQLDVLEGRWQKARTLALDHLPAPWISRVHEARMTLGTLDRHQGEVDAAWEHVERLLPKGPATAPGETLFAAALGTVDLAAQLALDAGDLGTAQRWIEAHARWLAWSGAVLWQPHHYLLEARYHQLTGDLDQAQCAAEAALACAAEPRRPLALIAAHRLLGQLHTLRRRFSDAEPHLSEALAIAGRCAAPYEQALSELAWAELCLATGQHEQARAYLDQARERCIPLEARPTLQRIEELTTSLAARTAQPTAGPDGLTRRETEVLCLIAAGKSNRQIAEALFLSPRTVERHVANIYLKIDVHTKAEATAYARRQQLA